MRDKITPENAPMLSPVALVKIGWITTVAWSPDGQVIAVAGGTQVRLYVRSFGATPTYVLDGHDAPVKDIAFSPDNRLIVSVGADGQAIVWAIDGTPHSLHVFSVQDSLNSVDFSPDSRSIVAGAGRGDVCLWSLEHGTASKLPYPHDGEVHAVRWAEGGVYSAGHDGELVCRNVADVRDAPAIIAAQSERIRDFAISDASLTYTVSKDGTLRGWTSAGDMVFRVVAHEGGADCVAVHPSGALVATGGRDSMLALWHPDQLRQAQASAVPLATLSEHRKPVLTLAFNPQGTMLLTGGGDNIARLWSVEDRNNSGN